VFPQGGRGGLLLLSGHVGVLLKDVWLWCRRRRWLPIYWARLPQRPLFWPMRILLLPWRP
jgi:hypothetical protein